LIQSVEARGGPAFIEVDRGACAPSLVHLRHVPGYTERAFHKRIRLSIPTCAATRAGTIAIPAGPFWRNTADGRDELASAEAFSIDATEVTRAAFDVYEAMAQWTDDAAAPAQHLQLPATERPRTPIVGVTFFEARNYCRFLGKDLPTSDQWQKAFRGGLVVNGTQNPLPQRSTPWAMQLTAKPANVDIGDSPRLAPIHSYTDDRSPYGVVDLAGNVSEWTLSRADTGLRLVLGGSWGDPPTDPPELPYRITWRNARADDDLSFSIGIRCVDAAH
jgi:formylglycine-generating enzyme required for sulfatase activity